MSILTEKMTAALESLKAQANGGGVTTQQVTELVHSIIDPHVAELEQAISAIHETENSTETKLDDLTAVLDEFTTVFGPAAHPQGETPVVTPVTAVTANETVSTEAPPAEKPAV